MDKRITYSKNVGEELLFAVARYWFCLDLAQEHSTSSRDQFILHEVSEVIDQLYRSMDEEDSSDAILRAKLDALSTVHPFHMKAYLEGRQMTEEEYSKAYPDVYEFN